MSVRRVGHAYTADKGNATYKLPDVCLGLSVLDISPRFTQITKYLTKIAESKNYALNHEIQ